MTALKKYLLVSICLLIVPILAFAQGNVQIIEKEGEAVLGEDTTPAQAKAQALNNARRAAIEEATGSQVAGSTVVYNFQVVSDLVSSATRGVIVKEEILQDEIEKRDKVIVYTTKIRAHVKPLEKLDTGALRILKESVFRYGAASAGNGVIFQDNDDIQVRARVSSPAYIHIFSIDKDGMVTKLYPNEYFKGEPVTSGVDFIFPSDKQREIGLKLRVRAAKNLNRTPESMIIIATKENMELLSDKKGGEVTITDLMKEVSELESPWVEKVLGYEVRR